MNTRLLTFTLTAIALATLGACDREETEAAAPQQVAARDVAKAAAASAAVASQPASAPAEAAAPAPAVAPQPNPERNAYFGKTHLHTSWSVDAWVMGNRITGPADAYQYAQGQTIKHPMGFDIKIDTPLDFMGAKACLCKPVDDEALLAAIGGAIGGGSSSTR